MGIAVNLVTIWIFIIDVGCQANSITPGNIANPVPTWIPTPADARLQNLIEKVRADLANVQAHPRCTLKLSRLAISSVSR